jgi:hypothetical protein
MTLKKTSTKALLGATAVALVTLAAAGGALADRGGSGPGGFGGRGGPGHGPALQLFEEIDADADGNVTRAELEDFRAARFGETDADADGGLSLAEFQELWLQMMRERMVDRFQKLDADGDGQVTPAEFDRPLDRMFAFLDRNEDGSVSKEEIRPPHKRGMERGEYRGEHRGDHGGKRWHDDD